MATTRNNPITTGKINGIVYDLRHWKWTLFVLLTYWPVVLLCRLVSGRNMWGGGRTTDATFLRGARVVRRGWWADLSGAARAALRLAVIAAVVVWFRAPNLVIGVGVVALVVVGWLGFRRFQAWHHERTVLAPVWPAVAGIIGISEDEPPARWLDIPRDMATTDPATPPPLDSMISVGLRPADADDEHRVDALVQLFDQRFGRSHIGVVDYAKRLVFIHTRPAEPDEWPAVAAAIGVRPSAPAADWLKIPADPTTNPIVVQLRADVRDDEQAAERLVTLFDQRHNTPHVADIDHARRLVLVRLRPAEPDIWPAIAHELGVPATELAAHWLQLPADPTAQDATIHVRLPAETNDDAIRAGGVVKVLNRRLDVGKWRPRIDSPARLVTITKVPAAPGYVSFRDFPTEKLAELRDTQWFLGKDWEGRHQVSDLEAMESPHSMVAGGSGSGKTTFLIGAASQFASRGALVVIFDPKYRFRSKLGSDLPNVIIVDDTADIQGGWERWSVFLESEMEDRLQVSNIPAEQLEQMRPEDVPDLDDRGRFPTIHLMIDEFGTFMSMIEQDWEDREEKGKPLIARTLMRMLWRGREARTFIHTAVHQPNAKTFPEGTAGRQLYGNRFMLGTDIEVESWRMLAGTGRDRPNVPSRIGAGVWIQGPSMKQIQAMEIKAKLTDNDARKLAREGISVLGGRGQLDDRGRFVLPGFGTLLTGVMAPRVADTRTRAAAPPVAELPAAPVAPETVETESTSAPEQVAELAPKYVRGLKRAAEFCGTSYDNFRKTRERSKLAGDFIEETEVDGLPAWEEHELKLWAQTRAFYRKNTTGNANKNRKESA